MFARVAPGFQFEGRPLKYHDDEKNKKNLTGQNLTSFVLPLNLAQVKQLQRACIRTLHPRKRIGPLTSGLIFVVIHTF